MNNQMINIYKKSYEFLLQMLPKEISEKELQEYFVSDNKNCNSLKGVFERFVISAQNYQRMPNVIKYGENKKTIRRILKNYNIKKVKDYDPKNLCYEFQTSLHLKKNYARYNSWAKWSRAIVDSAKFLDSFEDFDDFKKFVSRFKYNAQTRMALPLLIDEEINGIGFALACDVLKELGYTDYPKPDVHIIDVCSGLKISDNDKYSAFKAIIKISDENKKVDKSVTPYKVDKVIWLICSGDFYKHKIKITGRKKEFINYMKKII